MEIPSLLVIINIKSRINPTKVFYNLDNYYQRCRQHRLFIEVLSVIDYHFR